MVTRRDVVKYGLAGAALLALGGVGLAMRGTVLRTPAGPLAVLDPVEYSILWAIAERHCPANGAFPSASSLAIAEQVDAFLAQQHPGTQADVKRLLRFVENALPGLLLDGRTTTFTASSPEVQDAVMEGMRTSRLHMRRTVYKALTGLVGAAYYAHPAVWPAVGYPGPPDALRSMKVPRWNPAPGAP